MKVFVYGTLRVGQGAYRNFGLDACTNLIHSSTVKGTMYSMGGAYPGIRLDEDGVIHGDVLEITDPYILAHLDRYEGYNDRDPDDGLYTRKQTTTQHGDEVWIYEINRKPSDQHLIKSGNWLERAA